MSEREKVTEETELWVDGRGWSDERHVIVVKDIDEPHRTWLLMRDEVEEVLEKAAMVSVITKTRHSEAICGTRPETRCEMCELYDRIQFILSKLGGAK